MKQRLSLVIMLLALGLIATSATSIDSLLNSFQEVMDFNPNQLSCSTTNEQFIQIQDNLEVWADVLENQQYIDNDISLMGQIESILTDTKQKILSDAANPEDQQYLTDVEQTIVSKLDQLQLPQTKTQIGLQQENDIKTALLMLHSQSKQDRTTGVDQCVSTCQQLVIQLQNIQQQCQASTQSVVHLNGKISDLKVVQNNCNNGQSVQYIKDDGSVGYVPVTTNHDGPNQEQIDAQNTAESVTNFAIVANQIATELTKQANLAQEQYDNLAIQAQNGDQEAADALPAAAQKAALLKSEAEQATIAANNAGQAALQAKQNAQQLQEGLVQVVHEDAPQTEEVCPDDTLDTLYQEVVVTEEIVQQLTTSAQNADQTVETLQGLVEAGNDDAVEALQSAEEVAQQIVEQLNAAEEQHYLAVDTYEEYLVQKVEEQVPIVFGLEEVVEEVVYVQEPIESLYQHAEELSERLNIEADLAQEEVETLTQLANCGDQTAIDALPVAQQKAEQLEQQATYATHAAEEAYAALVAQNEELVPQEEQQQLTPTEALFANEELIALQDQASEAQVQAEQLIDQAQVAEDTVETLSDLVESGNEDVVDNLQAAEELAQQLQEQADAAVLVAEEAAQVYNQALQEAAQKVIELQNPVCETTEENIPTPVVDIFTPTVTYFNEENTPVSYEEIHYYYEETKQIDTDFILDHHIIKDPIIQDVIYQSEETVYNYYLCAREYAETVCSKYQGALESLKTLQKLVESGDEAAISSLNDLQQQVHMLESQCTDATNVATSALVSYEETVQINFSNEDIFTYGEELLTYYTTEETTTTTTTTQGCTLEDVQQQKEIVETLTNYAQCAEELVQQLTQQSQAQDDSINNLASLQSYGNDAIQEALSTAHELANDIQLKLDAAQQDYERAKQAANDAQTSLDSISSCYQTNFEYSSNPVAQITAEETAISLQNYYECAEETAVTVCQKAYEAQETLETLTTLAESGNELAIESLASAQEQADNLAVQCTEAKLAATVAHTESTEANNIAYTVSIVTEEIDHQTEETVYLVRSNQSDSQQTIQNFFYCADEIQIEVCEQAQVALENLEALQALVDAGDQTAAQALPYAQQQAQLAQEQCSRATYYSSEEDYDSPIVKLPGTKEHSVNIPLKSSEEQEFEENVGLTFEYYTDGNQITFTTSEEGVLTTFVVQEEQYTTTEETTEEQYTTTEEQYTTTEEQYTTTEEFYSETVIESEELFFHYLGYIPQPYWVSEQQCEEDAQPIIVRDQSTGRWVPNQQLFENQQVCVEEVILITEEEGCVINDYTTNVPMPNWTFHTIETKVETNGENGQFESGTFVNESEEGSNFENSVDGTYGYDIVNGGSDVITTGGLDVPNQVNPDDQACVNPPPIPEPEPCDDYIRIDRTNAADVLCALGEYLQDVANGLIEENLQDRVCFCMSYDQNYASPELLQIHQQLKGSTSIEEVHNIVAKLVNNGYMRQ